MDFRQVLKGGHLKKSPLWIKNVVGNTRYRPDAGEVPQQGGPLADRKTTSEVSLWKMGVPPPLGGATGKVALEGAEERITRRHNMVTQYIATLPTLDI